MGGIRPTNGPAERGVVAEPSHDEVQATAAVLAEISPFDICTI